MDIINVENLSKSYLKNDEMIEAIKDMSFCIEKGEIVCLIGEPDSGKTTLLDCISGLTDIDSGTIKICKVDIFEDPKIKRKIGYLHKNFILLDKLTVVDNIFIPQLIAEKSLDDIKTNSEALLCEFNIKNIEKKYPSEISVVQRRKLSIARVVANNPKIFLADNPTENLDEASAKEVADALLKLTDIFSITQLIATNDPYLASKSDRVIVIKNGKISNIIVKSENIDNFFDLLVKEINAKIAV